MDVSAIEHLPQEYTKKDISTQNEISLEKVENRSPGIRGFITEITSKYFDPTTGKKSLPKTDEEVEEIARIYGIDVIGMGSESVVFAKPSRTGTLTKTGHEQVISLFWQPHNENELKQIQLVSEILHTIYPDAYPLIQSFIGKVKWNFTGVEIPVTGTIRERVRTLPNNQIVGNIEDQISMAHSVWDEFNLPFNYQNMLDIEEAHGNVGIRETKEGKFTNVFLDTIRGEKNFELPDLVGFANYLRGQDSKLPHTPLPESEIGRTIEKVSDLIKLV